MPERRTIAVQGPVRTLEDGDLHCWPALPWPDRALRGRPPNEPGVLRDLCRNPAHPDIVQGRCRHSRQPGSTQKPQSRSRHQRVAPGCCSCRPTVPISIRSRWPSQSSKHNCDNAPSEPSTIFGRQPAISGNSSSPTSVKTTSAQQDMDSLKRPAL